MPGDPGWKLLHVLYGAERPLEGSDLWNVAGISQDQVHSVVDGGLVTRETSGGKTWYALTHAAQTAISSYFLIPRPGPGMYILVDDASAFLIMPYSEQWSVVVEQELVKSACTQAGVKLARADRDGLPLGNLSDNIVEHIAKAGVVIAVISDGNPNVLYELGIAHTLGKLAFVLVEKGQRIPVDLSGVLRIEYELDNLAAARDSLSEQLERWLIETRAHALTSLYWP